MSHTAKVALYNISMAGDTDEWFANDIKTETASIGHDVSMANAVLQQMLKVADWLVANGVQVVACQKCVHPVLKQYFKDKVCMTPDTPACVCGEVGGRAVILTEICDRNSEESPQNCVLWMWFQIISK